MQPSLTRAILALALMGAGWAAAKAQTTDPEFELLVNAPAGTTTIRCIRGCSLSWVERGLNPNASPTSSFEFSCRGEGVHTCGSGRVGGWIK